MRVPHLLVFALAAATAFAGCLSSAKTSDALAAQLHAAYHDQPFMGGQQTPDHEWTFVNSNHDQIAFLHWMGQDHMGHSLGGNAEQGDRLFAVGDGFKGRWCKGAEGVTQEEIDAGFVHFHKESAASWDAGHGGSSPSQVGYWLRHVAAQDGVEAMPGVVSMAGQVYPLMPSTAGLPDC